MWFDTRQEWARTQGNGGLGTPWVSSVPFRCQSLATGAKYCGEVGPATEGLDPQRCRYPLAWDDFNFLTSGNRLRLFKGDRQRPATNISNIVCGWIISKDVVYGSELYLEAHCILHAQSRLDVGLCCTVHLCY